MNIEKVNQLIDRLLRTTYEGCQAKCLCCGEANELASLLRDEINNTNYDNCANYDDNDIIENLK